MRAPSLVLALSLTALAGCLGADEGQDAPPSVTGPDLTKLSPKLFDVLPVELEWVASAVDGKRMFNAVYRPDTGEKVPVFINFSPYWGDTAELEGDHFAQYMIHEYVPRGYAVVLSAVRGTGHSEGCFQIGGDLELQDAYDVVDHYANVAWGNGNVGAGGKSYDSTTQNGMIAKFPHPALKTTFHVSGITDMYRYNYVNGVPYFQGPIFNTYYYFQGTDEYGIDAPGFGSPPDPQRLAEEDPDSLARVIDDAACTEFPQMQASGVGSGAHGLKDDYWIERDWNRYVADSDAAPSVFFVHGLQDWNVKPDHILPWLDLMPDDVVVKGWLHQWSRDPDRGGEGGHVYPMRTDWNETMLRWLDHWLKGVDTGLLDEPAFDIMGTDETWRSSDVWPPQNVTGLTLSASGNEATVVEAVDAPVRISGAPVLRVTATSTHGDPVLTAQLFDVSGSEREWRGEAVLRGIYRNGLEEPSTVTPNAALDYGLEFYPLDVVVESGHSLVIVVGEMPRESVPDPAQLEGVTYALDGATLALAWMPTEANEAQPTWVDCFAC